MTSITNNQRLIILIFFFVLFLQPFLGRLSIINFDVNPRFNASLIFNNQTRKVSIYVSGLDGTYAIFGDAIAIYLESKYENEADFPLMPTEGSREILNLVSSNKSSMGFCQSDIYDKLKSQFPEVTIVDTIYSEKLLLLTKRAESKKLVLTGNKPEDSSFSFLTRTNIGTEQSGTNFTMKSFYSVLEEAWDTIIPKDNLLELKTDSALQIIRENLGLINSVASVVGVPDKTFKDFLINQEDLYSFVTIEKKSSLETHLKNSKYELGEVKKEAYGLKNNITTVKIPALLIANKKVPNHIINQTINALNDEKKGTSAEGNIIRNLLDENNRNLANKASLNPNREKPIIRVSFFLLLNAILFFILLSLLDRYRKTQLDKVLSNKKKTFFDKIKEVIDLNLLDKVTSEAKLIHGKYSLREPNALPAENYLEKLNNGASGLSTLFELRNEINTYHKENTFSNSDYNFLVKYTDNTIYKLRKIVSLSINELIYDPEILIEKASIRKYLTAEMLNLSDYQWLIKVWRKDAVNSMDAASVKQDLEVKQQQMSAADLKNSLTDGRLKEHIERIRSIIEDDGKKYLQGPEYLELRNRIIIIRNELIEIETKIGKRTITDSDARTEKNKITERFLKLIDDLVKLRLIPS